MMLEMPCHSHHGIVRWHPLMMLEMPCHSHHGMVKCSQLVLESLESMEVDVDPNDSTYIIIDSKEK